MKWFNDLDSTTRGAIIAIVTIIFTAVLNHMGVTAPAPTVVNNPPAQVIVQPAAGSPPMVAAPAPK